MSEHILRLLTTTAPQDHIRITRLILDVARKLRDAGQDLTDPFVRSIIKLTAITSFWLSKSLGVDGVELEETGPGERDMHPLERRAMAYFTAHQRGLITTTSHGLPHFSRLAPQYQRALKVGLKWDIEHSENPDFVSKSPLHPASPDRVLLITLAALGNTDPDHWSPFQQQMAFIGATLAKRFVDKVCRPGAQTPAATSSVVTGGVAGGTAGNANASTGAPHAITGEPSNTDSTSASYARARTHAPRWRWPMKGLINRFSTFFGRFNRKTQPDTAESVSSSVRGIPPSLASVTDHAAKLAAEQREMFYKQTLDEALAHAAADKREELLKVYEQFKKLN